jgi:hypothetical protein
MPVIRNAHHAQFWDTPLVRTKSVTRFGVSVENVVATMEVPISHHGADRPEAKNSVVPVLARRAKNTAGANAAARLTAITIQSTVASCTVPAPIPSAHGGGSFRAS